MSWRLSHIPDGCSSKPSNLQFFHSETLESHSTVLMAIQTWSVRVGHIADIANQLYGQKNISSSIDTDYSCVFQLGMWTYYLVSMNHIQLLKPVSPRQHGGVVSAWGSSNCSAPHSAVRAPRTIFHYAVFLCVLSSVLNKVKIRSICLNVETRHPFLVWALRSRTPASLDQILVLFNVLHCRLMYLWDTWSRQKFVDRAWTTLVGKEWH